MAKAIETLNNFIREERSIMADHGTKKHKLLRALFGNRGRKKRMEKETEQKKRYAQHFKKAGPKHAMTYVEWSEKGEQPTYFKGGGFRRKTVEARLREAGIDPKRFKKKQ